MGQTAGVARIFVLDNYDSFVFNLVQYLGQLGAQTEVARNDALTVADVAARQPDGVLISPGPGIPEAAGISVALVRWCAEHDVPLLGVCLGHQALAVAFGARVERAPELLHGKTSEVHHAGDGIFEGLPDPFVATRYHSLAVVAETLPDGLEVTARTAGGVVMGLAHQEHPLVGVQYHPESVLTQGGHRQLANWLAQCGDSGQARERAGPLARDVEMWRHSAFAGPAA